MSKLIISPSTLDIVPNATGGFLPYALYSALRNGGENDVRLLDDATVNEVDLESSVSDVVVVMTNYGQITSARAIVQWLRIRGAMVRGYGFPALLQRAGLAFDTPVSAEAVANGFLTQHQPGLRGEFPKWILGECKAHFPSLIPSRPMVPVFASVGCPRKVACGFCPVGVQQGPVLNIPGVQPDVEQFRSVVKGLRNAGVSVHFMDEDLLRVHGAEKVRILEEEQVEWIGLVSSEALAEVLRQVPDFPTYKTCLGVEVGLENVEYGVSDKTQNLSPIVESGLPINWLTMSYLPQDTVETLHATEAFVEAHLYEDKHQADGMKTVGGTHSTGQFYIPYEDTPLGLREVQREGVGVVPPEYWVRQAPNYVGSRIQAQGVKAVDTSKITPAWKVYGVGPVDQYASELTAAPTIGHFLEARHWLEFRQRAMFVAVAARAGALDTGL